MNSPEPKPAVTDMTKSAVAARKLAAVGKAYRAPLILLALFTLGVGMTKVVADRLWESRLLRADLQQVLAQRDWFGVAVARGRVVYQQTCSGCHGPTGTGDRTRGAPSLVDDDWLYGSGAPAEIERTVTYGIRSYHPKSWNLASMPAFARPIPMPGQRLGPLTPGQIRDLVEFLTQVQGNPADPYGVERGAQVFAGLGGCGDCHGADARGDSGIGAPNLTDRTWLYGDGSRAALFDSIAYGRQGVCPSWIDRRSAAELREASLYVFTLSHPKFVLGTD
jgi:cytochrome c oxidase cbb3-type subunit 3